MNQQIANTNYHRPNLEWVCTAAAECGCPGGPASDGTCAGRSQCHPVKNDDRWECNRPSNRGGVCEHGPGPQGDCCFENLGCVPKRSLRSKRKVFVVSFFALVTGFLLIGIWGPNRNEFLAPGGLSSPHAQIWSGPNAEDRCIACHSAGASSPIEWLTGLFSGESHISQPQYQKCLACHQELIPAENALLAHNQPGDELAKLTSRIVSEHGTVKNQIFATPVNHKGELACANCHREHHGKDHDLAAMTDRQCQSCHANQFESFEQGHPEFKSFATKPKSGIQFDHYSHQGKYFLEAAKDFDCKSCHQGDARQDTMTTVSFETGCASCHDKNIEASLTQGLPVFSLPSIDVDLLRKNGLDVGQWPATASGSFDGTLPPVMKLLLAGDHHAMDAMNLLGSDFDLFEIDSDDREHLVAVFQLALSIKRLLFELSSKGQKGLIVRLENMTHQQIPTSQLRQMVSGLSSETFTRAQEKWFPDIAAEKERLMKPGSFIKGPGTVSLIPRPIRSARATPASYIQSDEDRILVENPLAKLYSNNSEQGQVQKEQSPKTIQKPIAFENLPNNLSNQSVPSTIQTARPTPPTNDEKFASGYQSGGAKAVANPFFNRGNKVQLQNPPTQNGSNQDQLAPNPIPPAIPPVHNQSKMTSLPPLTEVQNDTNRPANNSNLPIVIDDKNFAKQEIDPKQILSENPLKDLIKPQSKTGPDDSIPSLPEQDPKKSDFEKENESSIPDQTEFVAPDKTQTENQNLDLPNLPEKQSTLPEATPPENNDPENNDPVNDGDTSPKIESGKSETETELVQPDWDPNPLDPDKRVSLGGWYRDDETLTVAYRQSGHADELTRNWYDFVSSIGDSKFDNALNGFRQMIKSPTSPGQCGSCHQSNESAHRNSIQWTAAYRQINKRGFTRFSHRPHLVQPGNNQCATCHQMNPEASILANTGNGSVNLHHQSGFHPITKSNCASCHNQKSKTQSCTQCHNYHVGHAAKVESILSDQAPSRLIK